MAEIRSFVFETFAYDVAGNGSKEIATSKKKYLMIILVCGSDVSAKFSAAIIAGNRAAREMVHKAAAFRQ
jgi:hypothetical protein